MREPVPSTLTQPESTNHPLDETDKTIQGSNTGWSKLLISVKNKSIFNLKLILIMYQMVLFMHKTNLLSLRYKMRYWELNFYEL